MVATETFDRVQKIMSDLVGLKKSEVKMESHIMNDLGCDSIMIAEIIMHFEDDFGMRIPDKDVPDLKTIRDVVEYINARG